MYKLRNGNKFCFYLFLYLCLRTTKKVAVFKPLTCNSSCLECVAARVPAETWGYILWILLTALQILTANPSRKVKSSLLCGHTIAIPRHKLESVLHRLSKFSMISAHGCIWMDPSRLKGLEGRIGSSNFHFLLNNTQHSRLTFS